MTPEEIKQAKKLAYQKAKALREANPTYQALKAKHKEMRRAQHQARAESLKGKKRALRLAQRKAKDDELAQAFVNPCHLHLLKFD